MARITRRAALQTALLGGAAACATAPKLTPYSAASAVQGGAFAHGVASGDPAADSVVLWTRISTSDAAGISVIWEVAEDEAFASIRASGEAEARPEADYTVKVIAGGLAPGGRYFYRFRSGEAVSTIGRTKTLPAGATDVARFAIVSCSNYPFGYFNVYDLIARQSDLDAVLHLGDYIYEYGPTGYGGQIGERLGRVHEPANEIITLADYRRRHAQYKSDPSSQAMLAAHPLIATWDDHETSNNSWRDGAENHDPATEGSWEDRRRAALQAYYEWMPVREPHAGRPREGLFRSFSYGDLLTIAAIETRLMARGEQLDYNVVVPELKTPEDIARFRDETLWDDSREMLGDAQLDFLDRTLRTSKESGQPWRLIANQIIMASVIAPDLSKYVTEEDLVALEKEWDRARAFVQFSKLGLPMNLDAWDGYPAARERFYAKVDEAAGTDGLIVVTGDTHTWWANDLVGRDGQPRGVELGVTAVTSPSPFGGNFLGGRGPEYALLTAQKNESVRYISGENRGFIALEVRRDGATAEFIAVDTVESQSYNAFRQAGFEIAKKNGVAAFSSTSGLSFKERYLF